VRRELGAALGIAAAALSLLAAAQVRVERTSTGQIIVTNKGSRSAAKLEGSSKPSTNSRSKPLPPISPEQRTAIRDKLRAACLRKGLDYNLVASLVGAESDFRPNVLSHKGAIGLMQLMPGTAKRFGASDPWNVDDNIEGGTNFIAFLKKMFDGNIPLMLAGYNAGEEAVMKYGKKIPPYAETVHYVFTILNDYGRPDLVAQAKGLLAKPGDYDAFYVSRKSYKPSLRTFYMYYNAKGIRCITNTRPDGVNFTPIVYKDDWY
jgi:hypothetical protein